MEGGRVSFVRGSRILFSSEAATLSQSIPVIHFWSPPTKNGGKMEKLSKGGETKKEERRTLRAATTTTFFSPSPACECWWQRVLEKMEGGTR